jgi:hypothetical protein
MDKTRAAVCVWLADGAARLIVGAAAAQMPSRWAIQGAIVDERGFGVWLKADTIEEFRPLDKGVKLVNWLFKSNELFVRWDAIITIQAFEGGAKDIGFKATPE